jgi:homoserine dehydrogenase
VLAGITDILRDEGISVDSVLQKSPKDAPSAYIIITTHEASENIIIKAVEKITKIDNVLEQPNLIRII